LGDHFGLTGASNLACDKFWRETDRGLITPDRWKAQPRRF
jgi:hypothetical protein